MEMIRFENVTRTYQIGDCVLNALDGVNAFQKKEYLWLFIGAL